jgi:hypothetical protein
MRNYKAFVFTVDAIFALIVASAATSLLILTAYTPPVQLQGPVTESTSVSLNFLQATVGQDATSIQIAAAAADTWASRQYTWPQYGNNASESSSTRGFGPLYPFVQFSYQTIGLINPEPAVADGIVAFTTNGVGSDLYAINATTGALVFNTPDPWGGVFVGAPVIYHGEIYAVDSNDIVEAFTEHGAPLWGAPISGFGNLFMDAENGNLETNMSFVSPVNGSAIMPLVTHPAAYTDGEYVAVVPFNSVADELVGYSLYGNTLQQLWTTALFVTSNTYFTPIAADPNYAYFATSTSGGVTFNSYRLSGASNWGTAVPAPVQGGAAIFGNVTTFKTSNTIYGFTTVSGKKLFADSFATDKYYTTPSITPNYVYIETGGNVLSAYNELSGALEWSTKLQSSVSTLNSNTIPSGIAIAYGNAYAVAGNVLYALGTCSADPQSSLMQAIATMYLNGDGGCATLLLNKSYGSGKIAVIINNSYAPSLQSIKFSGGNYIYTEPGVSKNVANGNITMSLWVYPYSSIGSNGMIAGFKNQHDADFYVMRVAGTNTVQAGFRNSGGTAYTTNTANNIIVPNKWNNIILVYNRTYLSTYINGAETSDVSASGVITNTSAWLTMGAQLVAGAKSNTFNGIVSDVQLYNTSLSGQQVNILYNSGTGGAPLSGAVDWWPLEGDTNDYIGYYYGYSSGANPFVNVPSTPPGLQGAFSVSRSVASLVVGVNGVYSTRNVGIVSWR